jgi:hypothetical protein
MYIQDNTEDQRVLSYHKSGEKTTFRHFQNQFAHFHLWHLFCIALVTDNTEETTSVVFCGFSVVFTIFPLYLEMLAGC